MKRECAFWVTVDLIRTQSADKATWSSCSLRNSINREFWFFFWRSKTKFVRSYANKNGTVDLSKWFKPEHVHLVWHPELAFRPDSDGPSVKFQVKTIVRRCLDSSNSDFLCIAWCPMASLRLWLTSAMQNRNRRTERISGKNSLENIYKLHHFLLSKLEAKRVRLECVPQFIAAYWYREPIG